jgi:hypothetical protein
MKSFSATINIKASKEIVWNILTHAPGYPEWDPGVIRIEGTIAAGETITAYNRINPDRAFPATITEFVPGVRMTWTGGMPLGLFKGVRTPAPLIITHIVGWAIFTPLSPRPFPIAIRKGSLTSVVPGVKSVLNGDALPFSARKLIGKDLWVMYSPKGEGTVDFTLREEFSGPLLPLIGRSIPDMTQSFQEAVAGLKAHAETT